MLKTIKQKLYKCKGFTLSETLMTVLILLMATGIIAGGVPLAKQAYDDVRMTSHAQMLLSNTVNALRSELTTATNVTVSGITLKYTSARSGYDVTIKNGASGGIVIIGDSKSSEDDPRPLVSQSFGEGKIYVKFTSVAKDGKKVTFTDLSVYRSDNNTKVIGLDNYSVSVISE